MIKLSKSSVAFTKDDIQQNLVKRMNEICSGSFDVFVCLLSHASKKDNAVTAQVSLKMLVKETGFSIVKVWSCIQALIKCAALKKEGQWGKDKPLVYVFDNDLFYD